MKEDLGFTMGEYGNGYLFKKQRMTHEEQLQSDLFNKANCYGVEEYSDRKWIKRHADFLSKQDALNKAVDSERVVRYSRFMVGETLVVQEIIKPAKED